MKNLGKPISTYERLTRNHGKKAIVVDSMGNAIEGFIHRNGMYCSEKGIYLIQSPGNYTFIGKGLIKQITIQNEKKYR